MSGAIKPINVRRYCSAATDGQQWPLEGF